MDVFKNNKPMSDEELSAIEREEVESMQAINGHAYASPLNPEDNESTILMKHTKNLIQECQNGNADLDTDAELVAQEILTRSNREMAMHNKEIIDSKFKYSRVKQLPTFLVALLVTSNPNICIRKVRTPKIGTGEELYIPAVRGNDGVFSYLLKDRSNVKLNALIRRYNPNASKAYISEVYACIGDSEHVEKVEPTMDTNFVPTNNGVWKFDTWEKTHDRAKAFVSNTDPEYDKYTFTTKLPIDYDPDAENPVIHNDTDGTDWDVMTWINEIFNRDGQHPLHTQFLFELIHCAVRIFTCFGMGVWFLDESKRSKGGQGKGTVAELLRGLVGPNACKDTEVYYLEDPKKLSGLEKCNAIISDESSHHYIKHGANYKRLQRGEPVEVKTLYKDEYSAVFRGLILHCLNEPLSFEEKTGSVERTRVVLTWKTSYTDPASGFKDRKYIKNDYIRRPEVLRYLLKYTLEEMNITEFSQECLDVLAPNLEIVREKTNAVAQFMNEHEKEFVWSRIPFTYLYQLFCVWYTDTHSQKPQYSLKGFIDDVALWAGKSEEFEFHPQSFRPCGFMDNPEPLTKKYGLGYPWAKENFLQRWYDRGQRPLEDCVPPRNKDTTYKEGGLFRKGSKGTSTYSGRNWDESEYSVTHPATVQYVTTEYVDGKTKKYNLDPIVIEKKHFMMNEQEDCIVLSPVNMADAQGNVWPLEIDKKMYHIEYTKAELWLIPKNRVINEDCRPIREAVANVTAYNSEDNTDKQQDGQE